MTISGSLDNPDLLDKSDLLDVSLEEDRALWFYEARSSGWWLYEKRTAQELEQRLELSLFKMYQVTNIK